MNNRLKDLTWLVAALISIALVTQNFSFKRNPYITYDALGYWLYLPQAFVEHDLAMKNDSLAQSYAATYGTQKFVYHYHRLENGNHAMKYTMGMALYYLPAFTAGHVIATFSGHPRDGMSAPYQEAALVWNILVSILGIWAMRRVLRHFFSNQITALLLLSLYVGTNYFANIGMSGQNALTHNFLFTGYALLLWLCISWHAEQRWSRALQMAGLCGMMILARPTEAVCLFIPILWGVHDRKSLVTKLSLLQKQWKQVAVFAFVLLVIGMPQFIYWKMVTGHWIHTEYGGDAGEGFDWGSPHMLDVLFSFRKGWILYSPIMALALLGMVQLYRRQRGLFWAITMYFTVNLYLLSAWSCWWYAYSFGQRVLIPASAVMLIPMGFWVQEFWGKRLYRAVLLSFMVLCWALNIFQTFQYVRFILHGDRMTGAYYWAIFGKTQTPVDKVHLMLPDHQSREGFPQQFDPTVVASEDFEDDPKADTMHHFSGQHAQLLHAGNIYGYGLEKPYASLSEGHCIVEATAMAYIPKGADSTSLGCIFHWVHEGEMYGYFRHSVVLKPGEWIRVAMNQPAPELRHRKDFVKVFFHYEGQDSVWLDDVRFTAWQRKENQP